MEFDLIYDSMSDNYSQLENILGAVYKRIQDDPYNEDNKELFEELASMGQGMLKSQIGFASSNASADMKEQLVERLEEKSILLKDATEQTLNMGMVR